MGDADVYLSTFNTVYTGTQCLSQISLFFVTFALITTHRVSQALRALQVKQDLLDPRDLQESLVQRVCVESLALW